MEETYVEYELIETKKRSQNKVTCPKCHKKISHSTIRRHFMNCGRHKCQQCGKQFSYAFELREHRKTHEDSNIYNCEYCNKTYCNSYSFERHLKSRFHLSNKNFVAKHTQKILIITLKEVKDPAVETDKLSERERLSIIPVEEEPHTIYVEEEEVPDERMHIPADEESFNNQRRERSVEEEHIAHEKLDISVKENNFFNEAEEFLNEEEEIPHERFHGSVGQKNFPNETLHISVKEDNFADEEEHFSDERIHISVDFSDDRHHSSVEDEQPGQPHIIYFEIESIPPHQTTVEKGNFETNIPKRILKDKTNYKQEEEIETVPIKLSYDDDTNSEFHIITIERIESD